MSAVFTAAFLSALLLVPDPFVLLAPASLKPEDRRALDRGEMVSGTTDGESGRVGVFAISPINVGAGSLVASARAIEDLKRSRFILEIKRFSDFPVIEDLESLVLPPKELQAAAACRRGSCSLKLAAEEIDQLRRAAAEKDGGRDARVQQAFRRIVLARAVNYWQSAGDLAPLAGVDRTPATESFMYWSLESYGAGKPVVLITHINIIPSADGASATVIGRQIFANHYINDGLSVTAITTDAASGTRFLIYRNHTDLDLLGGILGPIRRAVLESRLRRDVPGIIQNLRNRLERSEHATR